MDTRHVPPVPSASPLASDRLLSVSEAARLMGLAGRSVRTMLECGTLAGFKVGPKNGVWRVRLSVILAYLTKRECDVDE